MAVCWMVRVRCFHVKVEQCYSFISPAWPDNPCLFFRQCFLLRFLNRTTSCNIFYAPPSLSFRSHNRYTKMVSRGVAASILLSLIALLAGLGSSAVDYPTTCYVLDGTHNSAAGFRCDNSTTGHSACCAAGGICYSNGVCQQSNGDVQDYLRVGCTDQTWKDPACLDQCTICKLTDREREYF